MLELLLLLLPVAAASGWWVARREQRGTRSGCAGSSEYFRGLNYLLDDRPDRAIEVFVRMARVDGDTADTHLTLGNLFRRRGEVDRAIHIHSDLISRPSLNETQRGRALLELGEDYMQAGLFDRAEALYRELVEHPGHTAVALSRLGDIYRQEKDWRQAIAVYDRLEHVCGDARRVETAHFCCELAEEAVGGGNADQAEDWLDRALARDPACVRASLLRGRIALSADDPRAAITALEAVEEQDRRFFPETLDLLDRAYTALGERERWLACLESVQARDHSGRLTAERVKLLVELKGEAAALKFLEVELQEHSTILGLRCFIDLKRARQTEASTDLDALVRFSRRMLNDSARYRCDRCGFLARSMHWSCPSCKTWNSVKPLPDLLLRNPP